MFDDDDDSSKVLDIEFDPIRAQALNPAAPDPASPAAPLSKTPGLPMLTSTTATGVWGRDRRLGAPDEGISDPPKKSRTQVKDDNLSLRGVHADRPERNGLAGASAAWGTVNGTSAPNIAGNTNIGDDAYTPSLMTAVKGEDKLWGTTFATRVSSVNSSPDPGPERQGSGSSSPVVSALGAARVKRRHSAIRQMLSSERLSLDSQLPSGMPAAGRILTEPDEAFAMHEGIVRDTTRGTEATEFSSAGAGVRVGSPPADVEGGKVSRFAFRSFHRTSADEEGRTRNGLFTASPEKLPPKLARQQRQQQTAGMGDVKRSKGSWFSAKFRKGGLKPTSRPAPGNKASPAGGRPTHFSPALGPDGLVPLFRGGLDDAPGGPLEHRIDVPKLSSTGAESSQGGFYCESGVTVLRDVDAPLTERNAREVPISTCSRA